LAAQPERLEVLIINNGRPAISDPILKALGNRPQVTVRDLAEPFNWSRFNNLGAAWTTAPNLVFANDDMVMLSEGWDLAVLGLIGRAEVGLVGARLVYADRTLQHAGVLFGWKGSVIHDGLYRPCETFDINGRWDVTRAVSAVTGAFLATRRSVFEALGGFDEKNLAVSYSDVDYALKARAQGLQVVYAPGVTAVHLDKAKAARNATERQWIEARWPGVFETEPGLNPFWLQTTIPLRMIAFPSEARVWRHIEMSVRLEPWRIKPAGE